MTTLLSNGTFVCGYSYQDAKNCSCPNCLQRKENAIQDARIRALELKVEELMKEKNGKEEPLF